MLRTIFATLAMAVLLAGVAVAADLPAYKATVSAKMPGIKLSLDCVIDKPVTEDVLRALGQKVFAENNGKSYKRVFIMWYLPQYKIGNGAWGVTNFEDGVLREVNIWALQG